MLAPRIRLLTTLSALYTISERERASRVLERAVRKKLYPFRFFSETFIHLSLFLGYPAMLDGLERLSALKRRRTGGSGPSRSTKGAARKGKTILRQIYGQQAEKLLARLNGLQPGLGIRITEDAYGSIMGRRGLSLADREIINVVILFIDGFELQLYSHLRGALRVGVNPLTLESVLLLAARLARKTPRRAIEMLRRLA
jgi:4-carboxymuconolactone decarboxylase